MSSAQTLIDKASDLCGGLNRLAADTGIDAGFISRVKNGKRPMSLQLAGELERLLGAEAHDELAALVLDGVKDGRERSNLARMLRVPASALACALMLVGAPADSRASATLSAQTDQGLYIMSTPCRRRRSPCWS